MLFALGLVLVHALAIQADIMSKCRPVNDISAFCTGKSVDLTNLSQLKELNQAAVGSTWSTTVKAAMNELVELIESSKDDL